MAAVDNIFPFLEKVREGAGAALTDPISRTLVVPGTQSAWDGCEQLAVRLVQIRPKKTDPRVQRPGAGCGIQQWILTIGIEVIRCAAVVTDSGPPSPRQINADAKAMTQDLSDIEKYLLCTEDFTLEDIIGWNPKPVDGGFHGGEWIFTVTQGVCPCG